MKLRPVDLRRARSTKNVNHRLFPPPESGWTPARLLDHYLGLLDALQVQIRPKTARRGTYARLTTTYYRTVRVPRDWLTRSVAGKAITLAHEYVHVLQWRELGRMRFVATYTVSPRWRWALEVQAYRESMRVRALLGASRGHAEVYAGGLAHRLWRTYRLWPLSKAHVYRYTKRLLLEAHDDTADRLRNR